MKTRPSHPNSPLINPTTATHIAATEAAATEAAATEAAATEAAAIETAAIETAAIETAATETAAIETAVLPATEAPSAFAAILVRALSGEVRPQGDPAHPALVYLASLAPSGRRTMRGKLEAVCEFFSGERALDALPWHLLRYQHIAAVRATWEERGLAPATTNATLYALRGVAKAAWNLGQMSADDYARIRNVGPVRGSRLLAGRCLSAGELVALLESCAHGVHPHKTHLRQSNAASGARDAALLAVLYTGGLRRTEAAQLQLENYDVAAGALKVRGKGNKERLVYLGEAAAAALLDWIAVRGPQPGALFQRVLKSGKVDVASQLSDASIYKALEKRALQAGVRPFSPHDLRRTFVGDLLERGADIVTVQHLAGHASVATTARYDRRGEETKRRAAHSLHLPYRKHS